jgi:hypothetical protein
MTVKHALLIEIFHQKKEMSHHPATFLLAVVLVEPLPQLRAGAEV